MVRNYVTRWGIGEEGEEGGGGGVCTVSWTIDFIGFTGEQGGLGENFALLTVQRSAAAVGLTFSWWETPASSTLTT